MEAPWGLRRGFCGCLHGGLRGVSGGLRVVSVPVFVGLRGVSGVLRGSPHQGGTQNIKDHSYVHETQHAQKPCDLPFKLSSRGLSG